MTRGVSVTSPLPMRTYEAAEAFDLNATRYREKYAPFSSSKDGDDDEFADVTA